ncbi:hypothetical protein D3C86_1914250 [compost metagenome]
MIVSVVLLVEHPIAVSLTVYIPELVKVLVNRSGEVIDGLSGLPSSKSTMN